MKDSERRVLAFFQQYVDQHGFSPKLSEIAEGIGIQSKGSVSRYVNNLIDCGKLGKLPGKRRGLYLRERDKATKLPALPLIGSIAAGKPIEALQQSEVLDIAAALGDEALFVLHVAGDSMIDDGILDGDYVICARQTVAHNGCIVVALINQCEATLKRFYLRDDGTVRLQPANPQCSPLIYPAADVMVQGVLRAVLRLPR